MGPGPRCRVVVADDHPSIRENLRYLLDAEDDLTVVGAARDATETMRLVLELEPDVLVLDNDMPVLHGLELLPILRRERPLVQVVMYTADAELCERALAAGARSCVTKGESGEAVIEAVRAAAALRHGGAQTNATPEASGHLALSDLRAAIYDGQLSVVLQPLVEVRSGRLTRLEALCRWSHPTRGTISPAQFIDLAEASALITPLTLYVARKAAADLRVIARPNDGVKLNFNISLMSLLDPGFHEALVAALESEGSSPRSVNVEVTETMLMREPAAIARALERLRALGMGIEVDDFGTGYSSLGRLVDLPIDAVKIDGRFVRTMTRDRKNESIVRATISLAHDLGLEVVAEGVEDKETWDLLAAHGCDTIQGYYVGLPMPARSVRAWLASWESTVLAQRRSGDPRSAPIKGEAGDILVVDDEPAIVEVIRGVLEHEGFRVLTAANGAEALRALERALPSLVILDMQMPILDGQAFVRTMRERELNVPIVVMTAGSSAARWARELSVEAYLSKPFEIDHLVEVASRYAGQH